MRRGAAIDRDDEARAFVLQRLHRARRGAIAFGHAIGNVEPRRRRRRRRRNPPSNRRRRRTVDIVIAEDRDRLAASTAPRMARATALSMSLSRNGSGSRRFSVGFEIARRLVGANAARRQQAGPALARHRASTRERARTPLHRASRNASAGPRKSARRRRRGDDVMSASILAHPGGDAAP